MAVDDRTWKRFFVAAALFNFAIGFPIFFFRGWAFELAFVAERATAGFGPLLWGDFGYCVALIGVGYLMVAFDLANRAMVWLGILAKAFDVIVLTSRWAEGIARPVVLLPAAIDFLFILGFVAFLVWRKRP
jgi:hypothetical protein